MDLTFSAIEATLRTIRPNTEGLTISYNTGDYHFVEKFTFASNQAYTCMQHLKQSGISNRETDDVFLQFSNEKLLLIEKEQALIDLYDDSTRNCIARFREFFGLRESGVLILKRISCDNK